MNNGKAILAVLAGAVAGAAIGILLAPDKGSETRKKMIKKGGDIATLINDKIDDKFDELLTAIAGKPKKTPQNGSTVKVEKEV